MDQWELPSTREWNCCHNEILNLPQNRSQSQESCLRALRLSREKGQRTLTVPRKGQKLCACFLGCLSWDAKEQRTLLSLMHKEVVHVYNGTLLGHKNEWNLAACNNMDDGPRGYCAKWNKSDNDNCHSWKIENRILKWTGNGLDKYSVWALILLTNTTPWSLRTISMEAQRVHENRMSRCKKKYYGKVIGY